MQALAALPRKPQTGIDYKQSMPVSRRTFVAGGVVLPAAQAMQSSRPSDVQGAKAPPPRRILESRVSQQKLAAALLPRDKWKPYPVAADRHAWEALPQATRDELLDSGRRALDGDWAMPPATLFLEFVRNGNRSNYERALRVRRTRLQSLVLAECVEGKGRFADEIANGIWSTCEESFWGYPAHIGGAGLPEVADPIIDLFAAEGAVLLAWTDYLLAPQLDRVHKKVRERLAYEVRRRIIAPYVNRDDFWWMGLNANRPMNNWNPWINSNCLACVLLIENDNTIRSKVAHKILRSLDRFLASYGDDGGCDEGPGYWGHAGGSLFDNLELFHSATNGGVSFYDVPLVGEIGRYIYRANIADDWYVNFADASARVGINGDLVYRFGTRIGDRNMQMLGAWAARRPGERYSASLLRTLPSLFNVAGLSDVPARQPLVRDVWLKDIQVMAARCKEGSPDGLYLAAQGGHNAESHNHNDVGNFIVYSNGTPVIVDVGVETYTAKTFSSRRYEIWTMQSAYHNLPTVNGVMQSAGREFAARSAAYRSTDIEAEFSLDLAAAYPREAGIEAWRRTLLLNRASNEVHVRDAFTLQKSGGRIELTLMTPCEVAISGPGEIALNGPGVRLLFDKSLTPVVEVVKTEDARLKSVWGARVHRILLKADNLPVKGERLLRIVG